jgi:hypothetical protein
MSHQTNRRSDQARESVVGGASVPELVRQILIRSRSIEDEATADFARFPKS